MNVATLLVATGLFLALGCGGISQEASDCAPSELFCSERCISPQNDNSHCGACDSACEAGDLCGNGSCLTECPEGQAECSGSCFDTSSDADNCGSCGNACDSVSEECRDGECVVPCSRMLNSGLDDPWGFAWDGNERPPTAHAEAAAVCEAFGGRLPTPTELFRVSANETGIVGQTNDTNPLWTSARPSPLRAARLRLSDGGTDDDVLEGENYFRCVCEPEEPIAFTKGNCYGDLGAECLALDILGKRTNIDAKDRPALTKKEAMLDCIRSGGQLADFRQYMAAIEAGAVGSDAFLIVADDSSIGQTMILRWDGNQAGVWNSSGNVTDNPHAARNAYRCVGSDFPTGTHPNLVPGEFVGRANGIKGEAADSEATLWAEAHDVCTARGGHLPTSAELADLILHGLPSGSSLPLWTADHAGFDGGDFRATMLSWTGIEPDWYYNAAAGDVDWRRLPETHAHRCIYYPLDADYRGPNAGECSGGCAEISLSGGAKMWFDSTDRPPAPSSVAHRECLSQGGFLPTERDLTEAIRAGLPNGSAVEVWASDYAGANGKTVRWTNVDTEFRDLYPTYQTWSTRTTPHAYRCMWTNEIR